MEVVLHLPVVPNVELVAAKAVEMLNQGALGLEKPSEKTVCRSCHYMGPSYEMGQFTHGEMNCLTCHIELKEKGREVDPSIIIEVRRDGEKLELTADIGTEEEKK